MIRRADIALQSRLKSNSTATPAAEPLHTTARAAYAWSGSALPDLAAAFGTPLYIYDAATLDGMVVAYQEALAAIYPSRLGSGLCRQGLAVYGHGSLGGRARPGPGRGLSRRVGHRPAQRVSGRAHPFSRQQQDAGWLVAALAAGVGRIVVNHADELATSRRAGERTGDAPTHLAAHQS